MADARHIIKRATVVGGEKSLPFALTAALDCTDGDEVNDLCERLKAAMERIHRRKFRIQIDHMVGLALVVGV